MPTKEIQLHDIKPLIEIQDYSLYYLIAIVVIGVVILSALVYLLVRYIKNRNTFNLRAEHLKLLQSVNFDDAKKAAYEITTYGATFKDDAPRNAKAYEDLLEHLEAYKYRKEVDSFSDEAKHFLEIYVGMIDV